MFLRVVPPNGPSTSRFPQSKQSATRFRLLSSKTLQTVFGIRSNDAVTASLYASRRREKKGLLLAKYKEIQSPSKANLCRVFFFFILPLPRNITKIGGMFTEKEKVIGVIDITSGGILITDAVWASALPVTTDSSLTLGLDIPAGKIPVLSMMRGGKRLLVIDVDGVWKNTAMVENVTVENPLTNEEVEKW